MLIKKPSLKIIMILALIMLALLAILIICLHAAGRPRVVHHQVSAPRKSETIFLSTADTPHITGETGAVILAANLTTNAIDGFQIVADITGAIPADLSFQTATISNLQEVRNELTSTDTGKRLELVYVTQDPQTPYVAQGLTILGKFSYTATAAGDMTVTFDPSLTKITKNQTAEDILISPDNVTYTFVTPTPSPMPTPSPTPTSGFVIF